MAKKIKKLEGWFRLQESGGTGKRKMTWDVTIDLQHSEMTFERIREEMDKIERDFGGDFSKFKIETEQEFYPYEDGSHPVTYVYGWRTETDEEFEKRLENARMIEKAREHREREEYERLAKKFGENK